MSEVTTGEQKKPQNTEKLPKRVSVHCRVSNVSKEHNLHYTLSYMHTIFYLYFTFNHLTASPLLFSAETCSRKTPNNNVILLC
jgi:hypothetical protein